MRDLSLEFLDCHFQFLDQATRRLKTTVQKIQRSISQSLTPPTCLSNISKDVYSTHFAALCNRPADNDIYNSSAGPNRERAVEVVKLRS
jgi:hypothetical protein